MNWPSAPDPKWLPFAKMLYGGFLTAAIVTFGIIIAIGKVSKETSYGLEGIIAGLAYIAAQFASWAFQRESAPDKS